MNRILTLSVAALVVLTGVAYAGSGAFLGVRLERLDEELAEKLKYKGQGAYVMSVVEDSPAEKAGIRDHTVIVKLDGNEIVGPGHLKDLLSIYSPGDKVKVKVWKDGKTRTLTVKLGEHESLLKNFKKTIVLRGEPKAWLGVSVQNLTEQLGEHFGSDKGVLVTEVVDDSPAKKAGIKAGDVITKVDDEEVEGPWNLPDVISKKEPGAKVTIHLVRDRKGLTKEVELGETPEDYRKRKRVFLWHSDDQGERRIKLDKEKLLDLDLLGFPGEIVIPEVPEIDIEVYEGVEGLNEKMKELKDDLRKEMEKLKEELKELKKSLKESK